MSKILCIISYLKSICQTELFNHLLVFLPCSLAVKNNVTLSAGQLDKTTTYKTLCSFDSTQAIAVFIKHEAAPKADVCSLSIPHRSQLYITQLHMTQLHMTQLHVT